MFFMLLPTILIKHQPFSLFVSLPKTRPWLGICSLRIENSPTVFSSLFTTENLHLYIYNVSCNYMSSVSHCWINSIILSSHNRDTCHHLKLRIHFHVIPTLYRFSCCYFSISNKSHLSFCSFASQSCRVR